MSYYDRTSATHLDGSRIFHSKEDDEAEVSIAALVQDAWDCDLKRFGALAPIDWYALRMQRLVGLLELKNRSHDSNAFQTVFLNARKWLALTLGAVGFGVPAIFVVRFTDSVMWTPVASIDASRHRIAGCTRVVKAANDIEPVIDVPVSLMRPLREAA